MAIKPEDICLADVAHHLAMIPRFGGACPVFYSVASHSMYVADLLPPGLRVEGLLHDASEAYCGDMIKSLKVLCPDYREVERRFESAVRSHFGLGPLEPDVKREIKRADIAALLAERRDVFDDRREYDDGAPGEPVCKQLYPGAGELAFLTYAERLGLG